MGNHKLPYIVLYIGNHLAESLEPQLGDERWWSDTRHAARDIYLSFWLFH